MNNPCSLAMMAEAVKTLLFYRFILLAKYHKSLKICTYFRPEYLQRQTKSQQ